MKSVYSILISAALLACAAPGCGTERGGTSKEPEIEYGMVAMPLTKAVGPRVYRLTGELGVYYHAPEGPTLVETLDLGAVASDVLVHNLREGIYDFELTNFLLFASENGIENDVTASATLTSPSRVDEVTIDANAPALLRFTFDVEGMVVVFDPCQPDPDVAACVTGDADGDGIPNGLECSSADEATCADTDGDETPDYQDTDSDDDGYLDGSAGETALLDPCEPNAYAQACVAYTEGDLQIDFEVTESCEGLECSFVDARRVVDVAGGYGHTCALFNSGQVACWGNNGIGQLGDDGAAVGHLTPGPVTGLDDAVALSAGSFHTCAVRASGQVACWGRNVEGQLGDGTFTNRSTPRTATGLLDAVALSAGEFHTCALRESGQLACWGVNESGQLGDDTSTTRNRPTAAIGINDAVAIGAGLHHTCALRSSGQVACWGGNYVGELGVGTTIGHRTPTAVIGISDAVALNTGAEHACVVRESGQLACWGSNASGQLGDGTRENRETPTTVADISDAVAVSAGKDHTCAVRESGQLACWGSNATGQLGDGTTTDRTKPRAVIGISEAVALSAAWTHTCALRESGETACWGSNGGGQLGDGTTTNRLTPTLVEGL